MPERPCPVYVLQKERTDRRGSSCSRTSTVKEIGSVAVGLRRERESRASGPVSRFSRISHDFFERGGGTDRCKFSRNKRNHRLFGCNLDLDSTQRPRLPQWICTRHAASLFRQIYKSSKIINIYILYF